MVKNQIGSVEKGSDWLIKLIYYKMRTNNLFLARPTERDRCPFTIIMNMLKFIFIIIYFFYF